MFDSELSAEKKLSKARAQLVMDDPFFGSMSMKLIIREDEDGSFTFPDNTIATDGREIHYNKKYIDGLSVAEVKCELAHEVGHVILKHSTRRKSRKPRLWNKACDQAVDYILDNAGYQLPKFVNLNSKFAGMAAEEIYKYMEQEGEGEGSGKYTMHGQVNDAPINLKDQKQIQIEEENITIAVEQAAKLAGSHLPSAIAELVEANKKHQISYQDLLRDFLETNLVPGDYDWTRPDRNYLQNDLYVPGLADEDELPNIIFMVDTSGSVGRKEKEVYAQEISGVLEEFPCKIKVIYGDTDFRHEQDIDAESFPIVLETKGGGGTNFAPLFKYIKKKGYTENTKAILFFTDMATSSFGKDPGIPVLWMNTYRPNDNCEVPFGKVIPLEIDERQAEQMQI